MRLHEIKSHSVGDDLLFEMFELLKQTPLFENNKNVAYYKDFINQENQYTAGRSSLTVGDKLFPVGLQSVPVGEVILVKYIDIIAEYVGNKGGQLFFNINNNIVDFPRSRDIGDGFLETLLFKNSSDQQQFLTALTLKFNGWTIKINKII